MYTYLRSSPAIERSPKTWAEVALRCNRVAYADDIILVAQSHWDIQHMYSDLEINCGRLNRTCGTHLYGNLVRVGGRRLRVEFDMVFPGALLCRDCTGAVRHRVGLVWAKFWAITPQLTIRVLNRMARLHRQRFDLIPSMAWGFTALHVLKEVLSGVESALLHMVNLLCILFARRGGVIGKCALFDTPGPS